jgi:tetratricopeptide (TPR) repeat protein
MARWGRWALLACLTLTAPSLAGSVDEDPLDLVALLVHDGRLDRALTALEAAPIERQRASWLARYHALSGLIAVGTERWEDAAAAFAASLEAARTDPEHEADDPTVYLQWVQALHRAGRSAEALARFDQAPAAALALSSTWLLRAQIAQAAGDVDAAWTALEEGARRSPELPVFPRQQVFLLVRLGMYQEAVARGGALLERSDATVEDVLVLAESLRRAGDLDRAAEIAATGRLRFPERAEVWTQSGAIALAQGRLPEAARDLTIAAEIDPALAYEASELWRQAGDLDAALRLNSAVPDPAKKARQRLGILLDQASWDQVVALEPRLERLEVLDEDVVLYGLAYARFQRGELNAAESYLGRIDEPAVFKLATALRTAMEACRDDVWACP